MSHSLYVAAAHVLRNVVGTTEPVLLARDDPVRDVLRVAAEACWQFAEVEYERDQARDEVKRLRRLLERVAEVLTAEPLPTSGGSWEVFTLAEEIRRSLAHDAEVAAASGQLDQADSMERVRHERADH